MKCMNGRGGWLAVFMAGSLALGACGDDPTGLDDHAEPEGVLLRLGGQTVASYDGDSRQWTGELTVRAGQETAQIQVVFLDHDGDPLETDEEEYLQVVVANTTIAVFQQDAPGSFAGRLQGKVVGQTTAVFKLMHGAVGTGHADFETTPVTVRVTS